MEQLPLQFLSISQQLDIDYDTNSKNADGLSMREGATMRREIFSDTQRNQLLSDLKQLQNKDEELQSEEISMDESDPKSKSKKKATETNSSVIQQLFQQNYPNEREKNYEDRVEEEQTTSKGSARLLNLDDSSFLQAENIKDIMENDSSNSSSDDEGKGQRLNKDGTLNFFHEESIYEKTHGLNFSKYQNSMYHKKSNATNLINLLSDARQGSSRQDSMVGYPIGSNIGLQGALPDIGPFSDIELKSGQSQGNALVNQVMNGQSAKKSAQNNASQDNSTLHLRFGAQPGNNTSYEMVSQNMYKSHDIMSQGIFSQQQQSNQNKSIHPSGYKRSIDQIKNNNKADDNKSLYFGGNKKKKNHVKNYLSIMYYVKKFTNILKTISTTYKFRSMNMKHFELIGDLSSNYRFFKLSQYLKQDEPIWYERQWYKFKKVFRTLIWNPINEWQCMKFLTENCYNNISVIQPESSFKRFWDFFSNIFFVINIFYIPVRVSFNFSGSEEQHILITFLLYYLPPILLIIEIVLNFNTAFYKQGMTSSNRIEIFKNYIKTTFFLDFLIFFTQIMSILLGIVELKSFIILRYRQVTNQLKQFEERLNLDEYQTAYLNLFKLVFMIVFIAHICGCSFFLVTKIETYYGETGLWTEKLDITDFTIFQQYITSLYWAVITMITLGYGDITPQNTTERAFVICVTMISCGTFAFSINEIGQIIQQLGKKANEQRKQINMLMSLMHKRGLTNIQLLMKIRRNFQYLLDQNAENNEEGVKFLQQLDVNLKNEVMRDIYGQVLSNKKIFQLHFSKNLIENLCLKMKEKTYAPEDCIIKEKELVNQIYFILQGDAQSYINVSSKFKKSTTTSQSDPTISILNNFHKGDIFGEKAFFGNQKSEYGVKAKTIVTVACLSIEDFIECLKEKEEDFEKFCLLRDNLQNYNITKGLGIKCFGCSQFTHTIAYCPHSKYIPHQDKVLYLSNRPVFQERLSFQRYKMRAGNTISIQDEIQNIGEKFIMEYNGIEVLQKYQEEREMAQQLQYISSFNNLKQIESHFNQQQAQLQFNSYNQLNQLENYGYVGNVGSYMANSPAFRPQQVKILQQYNKEHDFIISPEQLVSMPLMSQLKTQNTTNDGRTRELSVIQDEQEKSGLVSDLEEPLIRDRGSSQTGGGLQKAGGSRFQNEITKYEQQQQQQQQQLQQIMLMQQQQQLQLQQQVQFQRPRMPLVKVDSYDAIDQASQVYNNGVYEQNFQNYLTPKNGSKMPSSQNIYGYIKSQQNSQFSQYASLQDTNPSHFRNSFSNTPMNNPSLKQQMQRDSILIDKEKLQYLQPRQLKTISNSLKEESDSDDTDNKGLKKKLSNSGHILSPELTSQDNQRSSFSRMRESSSQWNNKRSFVNLQTINQNWKDMMNDKDQFFILSSFEVAKNFAIYFPHNNQAKVLHHYTQSVMKTLKKPNQVLSTKNNRDDIQKIIKSYQSTLLKSPKKRNITLVDRKSIFTMYKSEGLIFRKKETNNDDSLSMKNQNLDISQINKSSVSQVPVGLEHSQNLHLEKGDSRLNTMRTKKFHQIENNGYLINNQKQVIKQLHKKTQLILQRSEELIQKSYLINYAQNGSQVQLNQPILEEPINQEANQQYFNKTSQ